MRIFGTYVLGGPILNDAITMMHLSLGWWFVPYFGIAKIIHSGTSCFIKMIPFIVIQMSLLSMLSFTVKVYITRVGLLNVLCGYGLPWKPGLFVYRNVSFSSSVVSVKKGKLSSNGWWNVSEFCKCLSHERAWFRIAYFCDCFGFSTCWTQTS